MVRQTDCQYVNLQYCLSSFRISLGFTYHFQVTTVSWRPRVQPRLTTPRGTSVPWGVTAQRGAPCHPRVMLATS